MKNLLAFIGGCLMMVSIFIYNRYLDEKPDVCKSNEEVINPSVLLEKNQPDIAYTPSFILSEPGEEWVRMSASAAFEYMSKEDFEFTLQKAFIEQNLSAMSELSRFYECYCVPDRQYYSIQVMLAMYGNDSDFDQAQHRIKIVADNKYWNEVCEEDAVKVMTRLKKFVISEKNH